MVGALEPVHGEDDWCLDVGDPHYREAGRGRVTGGTGHSLLGRRDVLGETVCEMRTRLPTTVGQRVLQFESALAGVAGLPSASFGVCERLLGGDTVRLNLGEFGRHVRQFCGDGVGVGTDFPPGRQFPAQGRGPFPERRLASADLGDPSPELREVERRRRAVGEALPEVVDGVVLWRGRPASLGSERQQPTATPYRPPVDESDEPVERTGCRTVDFETIRGLRVCRRPDRGENVGGRRRRVTLPEVDRVAGVRRLGCVEAHGVGLYGAVAVARCRSSDARGHSGSSANSSGVGWSLPTANFAYGTLSASRSS